MIYICYEGKHYDILFLEKRLRHLIHLEEYEKAARVRKWIDELALFHHNLKPEELNKFIRVEN
jgi:protein-arginine kinase activator protein McsA